MLWVVWYIHITGPDPVIMGLYESEDEANRALAQLQRDKDVVKAGKTLEPVFYK